MWTPGVAVWIGFDTSTGASAFQYVVEYLGDSLAVVFRLQLLYSITLSLLDVFVALTPTLTFVDNGLDRTPRDAIHFSDKLRI